MQFVVLSELEAVPRFFARLWIAAGLFALHLMGGVQTANAGDGIEREGRALPLNRFMSIQVLKWRSRQPESAELLLNAGDLQSRLESFFANASLAISEEEARTLHLSADRPVQLAFTLDGHLIGSESNRPNHPLLDEERDTLLARLGLAKGGLLSSYLQHWLEHTSARLALALVHREDGALRFQQSADQRRADAIDTARWERVDQLGAGSDRQALSRSSAARARALLMGRGNASLSNVKRAAVARSALLSNAALLPIFGSRLNANLVSDALPRLFNHPGFEEDSEAPSQLYRAIESLEWALRVINSDGGRAAELRFREREIRKASKASATALVQPAGSCGSVAFGRK